MFLSKTLWYVQQGSSNLYEQISEVLDHLEKPKLINSRGDSATVTYEITPLGRATFKGSYFTHTLKIKLCSKFSN